MAVSRVDLHLHSDVSLDGEYPSKTLVQMAHARGVELIALADHNAVRGIGDAIVTGREWGVGVVPAVELDCVFEGIDLHLLGYGIRYEAPAFAELEIEIDRKVRDIFPKTLDKLSNVGIEVNPERVLAAAGGKPPCGELIAEVLLAYEDTRRNPILAPYLEGGDRSDMPNINFYRDYCAQGKPAYVPIAFMSLEEAIDLVKRSGGLPVIAHPGNNLHADLKRIDRILDVGVEGIEVYSSYHGDEEVAFFRQKAFERHVTMTCGSDFHGKNKPLIQIGHCYAGEDERTILAAMRPYSL